MTIENQAPEGAPDDRAVLRHALSALETARDHISARLEHAQECYRGYPDRWAAEYRDLRDTDVAIAKLRAALAAQPDDNAGSAEEYHKALSAPANGDEPQRYSPDGEGGMEIDSLGAWVKFQPAPQTKEQP